MMRALTSDGLGEADAYALREMPIPSPGDGQVRLRVDAAALGYVDALIAAGRYQHRPAPPYIPGAEIVGVIDQCGADVRDWRAGDRVAVWQLLSGGGLANYAVVSHEALVAVPPALSSASAAGYLLDYLTVWYALFDRGHCKAGETVLVLGAAGGVGSAAVALAAHAGARVVAAAASADKRALAEQAGAAATIDYTAADWRDQLRMIIPGGVDIVVDPVGGASMESAFRSLAKDGRYLVLGFAGGTIPALPINLPLLKNGSLIGIDARYLFESDLARALEIWSEVLAMASDGRLGPRQVRAFPFALAADALRAVTRREFSGKVTIVMDAAA